MMTMRMPFFPFVVVNVVGTMMIVYLVNDNAGRMQRFCAQFRVAGIVSLFSLCYTTKTVIWKLPVTIILIQILLSNELLCNRTEVVLFSSKLCWLSISVEWDPRRNLQCVLVRVWHFLARLRQMISIGTWFYTQNLGRWMFFVPLRGGSPLGSCGNNMWLFDEFFEIHRLMNNFWSCSRVRKTQFSKLLVVCSKQFFK